MRTLPFFLFTLALFAAIAAPAQAPFTELRYGVRVEGGIVYGAAPNYAGVVDALTLDLYKPVGDCNTARPLLVLVHGGSWLNGCSEGMAWLAFGMAARGYVVASVNYRKGWHKDDFVPNPFDTGVLYAADTAEIVRAMYRGMQDVRGAIRFLQARSAVDSTSKTAILVGGESAGGYISLMVGLLDRPEEKPLVCGALPDAVAPQPSLCQCYDLDCLPQNLGALPAAARARPDLGSIDGALNLNGESGRVVGVINLFGGLPAEALSSNWLQGPDTPAIYLYHQTCDGVVPFGFGIPSFTVSANCNLGFTPWHLNLPYTIGSGTIAGMLEGSGAVFTTDFLTCPSFDPNLAFFECLRYAQNGAYHFAHNQPERAQAMADFFGPVVAPGSGAPCTVSAAETPTATAANLRPNPFNTALHARLSESDAPTAELLLYDLQGRLVHRQTAAIASGEVRWAGLPLLPPGVYGAVVRTGASVYARRMLRL